MKKMISLDLVLLLMKEINELKIEINMDNIKKDVLLISVGENDDYNKVVDDFCEKHELNDEKRNKLIRFIENKIGNIENKNDK